MASQGDFYSAMTNRSLRIVRSELEFLADSSVITPQQLSSILSQLPSDENERSRGPVPQQRTPVQQAPVAAQPPPAPYSPPTNQFANTSLNEKASYQQPPPQQYSTPSIPPPAYAQPPPALSVASALYAYTPTDPGDLALQPHDRVQVLEHMNADWWRGRNERTNLEGIFPRSYVNVLDEKALSSPPPTNYGNMPLEVSQSGSTPGDDGKKSKFEEQGKKFGKKMGNAAIFGAGATVGSNIVNSIF
ncbi:SH3-domain-containing protein [Aspergillus heteromorphus CBS 117.55]|uniref:SH3-domain-containing protein n=1 Tax=Aspergillus heteromorphus CBS 117.55 TaxID=1448321 RepID=A0A317X2I4_9EURO|nr:SH3-domain-containing protein [Aspergillus heteromorphus CBS 117.55]PWY92776.1 SH3-domain-containing protein [Aspergillus heteromorphus CBS 117.55]